jgi:hypothetical protein
MKLALITIGLLALGFAGIAIKIWAKKRRRVCRNLRQSKSNVKYNWRILWLLW